MRRNASILQHVLYSRRGMKCALGVHLAQILRNARCGNALVRKLGATVLHHLFLIIRIFQLGMLFQKSGENLLLIFGR